MYLKAIFDKKVVQDYEILGQSSKKDNISFCINANETIRLVEPVNNNTMLISMAHTKFFDIGMAKQRSREIVINDLQGWDTSNIELLKPVSDRITSFDKLIYF